MHLLNSTSLTQYFQENKDKLNYSDNFRLRIHRALSWLKKAEQTDELDSKFIFLWITFNASYAKDLGNLTNSERESFNDFLFKICQLDNENLIYDLVWERYSQSIRLLIDNPFIAKSFWDFHNLIITEEEYLIDIQKEKKSFRSALETQNTEKILLILFKHLYTLRNQIIHGGSTFNSSVNREQLRGGCNILSFLLPVILDIMLKNHTQVDWGKPFYPVIKR